MDLRELQLAYFDIPPITRAYSTACVFTTALVHFDVITPYKLYFSPKLIFDKNHWWRFFSPFCYFGPIGFPFLFNMIFTYRYCRMLEESSFRNKAVDMVVMFVFGGILMLFAASYLDMLFLGQAFTIMLVYVWSRRNPQIRMNFFGVLNFSAPYLPWVLLAFSFLLGNSIEVDAVGIAVGHAYYFLEDVFPHQVCGFRLLNVRALARLFANESNERDGDTTNENENAAPLRDDVPRAGGLGWNAQDG